MLQLSALKAQGLEGFWNAVERFRGLQAAVLHIRWNEARQALAGAEAQAREAASEVEAAAREAAAKLAQRPIGAVMAAKKLMRDGEKILAQSRTESAIFGERLRSAEAMEAFTAFREKRAPDFSKL